MNLMSRFLILHVVDTPEPPAVTDLSWKINPVMESICGRLLQLLVEENVTVDEAMIPFKGQSQMKQYMKGKPHPWGIKLFMLCGTSGI